MYYSPGLATYLAQAKDSYRACPCSSTSVQVVLDTNFRSEVPVWNKDTNRGNIGLSIWINYGLMRCFCGTGFTEFYLLRPLCTALKIKTFQLRSKNFHVKIEIPQRKNNDCIFRSLVSCDLNYNNGLYCIFVLLPTFFAQVFLGFHIHCWIYYRAAGISKNFGEDKLMWWA